MWPCTTLAEAGQKLDGLAATLARGKTRRPRDKFETEITAITRKPWVRRVVTWQLAGEQHKDLRLSWSVNQDARAALEDELFGSQASTAQGGRRNAPPDSRNLPTQLTRTARSIMANAAAKPAAFYTCSADVLEVSAMGSYSAAERSGHFARR